MFDGNIYKACAWSLILLSSEASRYYNTPCHPHLFVARTTLVMKIFLLSPETLGPRYDSERSNTATARRPRLQGWSLAVELGHYREAMCLLLLSSNSDREHLALTFPDGIVQSCSLLDYAFIASSFLIASLTMLPHNFACGLVCTANAFATSLPYKPPR